jgi:hypothetical protein
MAYQEDEGMCAKRNRMEIRINMYQANPQNHNGYNIYHLLEH